MMSCDISIRHHLRHKSAQISLARQVSSMHSTGRYWSADLRYQCVAAVKNGATPQEVADMMLIPRRTIVDWVVRDKCGFSLDTAEKEGAPRCIDDPTLERMCAAVDKNPFVSDVELVRQFHLTCTPRTVANTLASHNPPYTWKKPSLDNANYTEENLLLNKKWGGKIWKVPHDLRLYEDEAGIHDRLVPLQARAPQGKRAYLPRKSRGKLFQYALLINDHELLHPPYLSKVSFNDEVFKKYAFEHVVPHVFDDVVVCWDRLGRSGRKKDPDKQHFNPEVQKAVEAKGGEVWLLPPYGKFWNPAENVHSFLKGNVRQAYADSPACHEGRLRTRDELEADLLVAADNITEEFIEAAWRNRADGREFKETFPQLYKK